MIKGQKCLKGSLAKMGEKNPMFGKLKENVTYGPLHEYVKKRLVRPDKCEHCHQVKKLELANRSGKYKRDLTDWLWLCKKCHHKYDGHEKYLDLGRQKGIQFTKKCLNCEKEIPGIQPSRLERKKYCSRQCLMLYRWKNNLVNHI